MIRGTAVRNKLVAVLIGAALAAGLASGFNRQTPEQIEKRAKEAIAAAQKKRAALGAKFLPKPEDFGLGWLTPWELPEGFKKNASEAEYWQSLAGDLGKDDKAFFAALISMFLDFEPEELTAFLDTLVSMTEKELKPADIPEGMTAEQFALSPLLLLLRWEYSPSLADKWEMVTVFLEDMQKWMAAEVEKKFGGASARSAAETAPYKSEREVMQDILVKPFKSLSGASLREEIRNWAEARKDMTGMTYTTCDDWNALRKGDEKSLLSAHLRHAVVTLSVFDRKRMAGVTRDLTSAQAAALQQKMNSRLGRFREFGFDVLMKKRTSELQEEIEKERNPERKNGLQEELAHLPQLFTQARDKMPRVDFEVGTRDFGDNCYVIQMIGSAKLPEFAFPATNLQACLRNGNAVVFVGLGGNYEPGVLKKELDKILSEMDARTAFFR